MLKITSHSMKVYISISVVCKYYIKWQIQVKYSDDLLLFIKYMFLIIKMSIKCSINII